VRELWKHAGSLRIRGHVEGYRIRESGDGKARSLKLIRQGVKAEDVLCTRAPVHPCMHATAASGWSHDERAGMIELGHSNASNFVILLRIRLRRWKASNPATDSPTQNFGQADRGKSLSGRSPACVRWPQAFLGRPLGADPCMCFCIPISFHRGGVA
jgi:hypothetical protein